VADNEQPLRLIGRRGCQLRRNYDKYCDAERFRAMFAPDAGVKAVS